jgi:hypothetical protein
MVTELLAVARDSARERDILTMTAVGGALKRDLPFAIVRQLLEPVLRPLPPRERADMFAGSGVAG